MILEKLAPIIYGTAFLSVADHNMAAQQQPVFPEQRLPAEQPAGHAFLQALRDMGIRNMLLDGNVARFAYKGRECTVTIDARANIQSVSVGTIRMDFPSSIATNRVRDLLATGDAFHGRFACDRPFAAATGPSPRFTSDDGVRYTFVLSTGEQRSVIPLPGEVEQLDALERVSAPSEEDFRAWQRAIAAEDEARKALLTFCIEHGFGNHYYPRKEDFRGREALYRRYREVADAWDRAHNSETRALGRCATRWRHYSLGAVTDHPTSPTLAERHNFIRKYRRNGRDVQEFYFGGSLSHRETEFPPRPGKMKRQQNERYEAWRRTRREEWCRYGEGEWHIALTEVFRRDGTMSSHRVGDAVQYFHPHGHTVAAGEVRRGADGREYVTDIWLQGPRGERIGTFRQHVHQRQQENPGDPDYTPEQYIADVAPVLSRDPHLLQLYFRLYWRFTRDRTPNPNRPEDRWRPGEPLSRGDFRQTIHQTLQERQEGIPVECGQEAESLFGDCDDLAELAAYMLQSQGIRAYNIGVHMELSDGSKGGHGVCFWLERRPDGQWNAHSQCTLGGMKNGFPLDECPADHHGYATPEECFHALVDFYGRHGLHVTSFCEDGQEGMNLRNIWHIRPTDVGPDQALTVGHFLPGGPGENRPLPPPPAPERLKGLMERMVFSPYMITLGSSFLLLLLLLYWEKNKEQRRGQPEWIPQLPFQISFAALPKPLRGKTYADSTGLPWTVVEWDPPNERLTMPATMHGALQLDGGTLFFIANVPTKSGKTLHVELRTSQGNIR